MKLVQFEGGKSATMTEAQEALENMHANLAVLIEYQKARAELKRAYYSHLVEQGFTESEALSLVAQDTTY